MPRRKAIDVAPIFEQMAVEVARVLSKELDTNWRQLDQRLSRIENALKTGNYSNAGVRSTRDAAQCSVDDCHRPVRAKGLCGAHYQQLRYRIAKKSEGKEVRSRKDEVIPGFDEKSQQQKNSMSAQSPEEQKAIHMFVRKKQKDNGSEAERVYFTTDDEQKPLAYEAEDKDTIIGDEQKNNKDAFNMKDTEHRNADDHDAIHPSLRPIV